VHAFAAKAIIPPADSWPVQRVAQRLPELLQEAMEGRWGAEAAVQVPFAQA
jgi:hypothetical protein